MTENGSDFLPLGPPEQENIRLRDENARVRRLLAAHSIPIPQLAPEKPPPIKAVEPTHPVDKKSAPGRESHYFEVCFAGERMSTQSDGRTIRADMAMCLRT